MGVLFCLLESDLTHLTVTGVTDFKYRRVDLHIQTHPVIQFRVKQSAASDCEGASPGSDFGCNQEFLRFVDIFCCGASSIFWPRLARL